MTGLPIWYELMTTDPAHVAPFYNAVLGWTIPDTGNPMPNGTEYREIERSTGGWQGGVLTITQGMADNGVQPFWAIYFHVGDVDAAVDQATEMGARVLMEANSMEGVGRMAMLSDPQGASFYVMTPTPPPDNPDAQSDVFADKPGHCAWNELNTEGAVGQIDFYTSLFGWEVGGEMEMPGDHIYKFLNQGETGVGAIGSMKPEGMANAWLPYFRVEDIHAAKTAVETNGGGVMMGPHEVPGGDHIIVAFDPLGAPIGIVGKAA